MLRLVAIIVTLSFLFAISATTGTAVSLGGAATTVAQTHPAHLASTLTADVPIIENDGNIEFVLIASFVHEASSYASDSDLTRYSRCIVTGTCDNVPRYLAARRIQI